MITCDKVYDFKNGDKQKTACKIRNVFATLAKSLSAWQITYLSKIRNIIISGA